ncbi:MAG: SCP2 sterol-binding domain-containing protein [Chloroflexi bacterium]|nr:SCP2 sterol-binding domain-containing protein [Chloroflexota bacterium]
MDAPGHPDDYLAAGLIARHGAAVAQAPAAVHQQAQFTVAYTVGDGATHWFRIADGQLQRADGALEYCDMRLQVDADSWHAAMRADDTEWFIDYYLRGKIGIVKSLRGRVTLELGRADGGEYRAVIIFGECADPELTVLMTNEDFAAMMRGDLNGNMAFMSGRLRFEGSLPLLLQLGALSD